MEPSSIFNHPLPFQTLKIQLLKAKTIDEISKIYQQNQEKFDLKNQNNPDYDFLKCLIILVKSFRFDSEKFKISALDLLHFCVERIKTRVANKNDPISNSILILLLELMILGPLASELDRKRMLETTKNLNNFIKTNQETLPFSLQLYSKTVLYFFNPYKLDSEDFDEIMESDSLS